MQQQRASVTKEGHFRIELKNENDIPEYFLPVETVVTRQKSKAFAKKESFFGKLYIRDAKVVFNPGEIAVIEWIPYEPLPKNTTFTMTIHYFNIEISGSRDIVNTFIT